MSDCDDAVDDAFNTCNGIGVSALDFTNINMQQLFAAATSLRRTDGSLPDIGLHLDSESQLIDAGTNVGLRYRGKAPDLGAFELER